MTDAEVIRALEELRASQGWGILVRHLQDEMDRTMSIITNTPDIDLRNMDYYRGRISAGVRVLSAPAEIIQGIKMEQDIKSKKPLKEDQKDGR